MKRQASSKFVDTLNARCTYGAKFCNKVINRWAERESLVYMKRFFNNPDLKPTDITKQSFIPDAYQEFMPIVISGLTAAIPVNIIAMMQRMLSNQRMSDIYSNLTTYEAAERFYNTKYQKKAGDTDDDGLDFHSQANGPVIAQIMTWPDSFDLCIKAMSLITDFILNNCVENRMVANDLALKKLPEVVKFFHLNDYGAELLKFCYVFRASNIKLPRDVQNFDDRMMQVSQMSGVPKAEVVKFAAHKNKGGFTPFIIETLLLQDNIWTYIANELSTDLESCFYKTMDTNDVLPREFFDEIDKKHTDTIVNIINGKSGRPRHILLYGLPGTGKTSYMKLLCKLTNRQGYGITQIDNIGNEGRRDQIMGVESRFMSVRICDGKINPEQSIIIIDEADEMINCSMMSSFGWFSGENQYNTKSKSMLNQIMDEMKTPVIWITNNPASYIDPSCRRRFDYSVFFDEFTETQRKLIWSNNVKRFGLGKLISAKDIEQLASDYQLTPGGIALACMNIKDIFDPSKKPTPEVATQIHDTLIKILDQHSQLLGMTKPEDRVKKFKPCKQYSLDGLNITSTIPLAEVEKMCRKYLDKKAHGDVERSMCILLQGPSGTGKTEFTKYLGSVLKKNVEIVRGSTVLDMYVGNTEKRIAGIFDKAEKADSILFIDEVDSLLFGRDKAMQSWQVSQVNEILQQMENFRGIFIAATNFADNMDMASVRRFAFKFTFDTLTEDGIVKFYNRYFGKIKPNDKLLPDLKNLREVTPGDFATVKMLSEYSTDKIDLKWVIASLRRELDAKSSNSGAKHVKPRNLGY